MKDTRWISTWEHEHSENKTKQKCDEFMRIPLSVQLHKIIICIFPMSLILCQQNTTL